MDKIALISGGLGDIGGAIAVMLGRNGVHVALSDVADFAAAQPQLEKYRNQGCVSLSYHQVDVTLEAEVSHWIDVIERKWGLPQIIVPNAGIVVSGTLTGDEISTAEVQQQMNVNFWGSYFLAVAASKKMKARKMPGRIIFIGSWAAERANARISAYCISKASVRMLCKAMALELAGDDILVNEVAPGIVEGGLSKKNQQENPELLKVHLQSTPTHKLVSPNEIARQVLFLSQFEDMNITGATFVIDGGLSLTSKMTP